jgi:hypothetical protein
MKICHNNKANRVIETTVRALVKFALIQRPLRQKHTQERCSRGRDLNFWRTMQFFGARGVLGWLAMRLQQGVAIPSIGCAIYVCGGAKYRHNALGHNEKVRFIAENRQA